MTSLAAEYPQGLCEELAKGYAKVATTPVVRADFVSMWASGTKDPCRTTKKDQRRAENEAYVGGLRDPAAAVAQISGWTPVGEQVATTLSEGICKFESEFVEIFRVIGTEQAHGPSE